jgi:hypothetical protein
MGEDGEKVGGKGGLLKQRQAFRARTQMRPLGMYVARYSAMSVAPAETSGATGFSLSTCLPALSAARTTSGWTVTRDREDDDNRLDVVARKQCRERSLRRRCAALRCDVVVDRWARRQVQRVLRVLRKPVRGLLRARVDGDEVEGRPVGGDLGKRGQMSCYAMNSPTE